MPLVDSCYEVYIRLAFVAQGYRKFSWWPRCFSCVENDSRMDNLMKNSVRDIYDPNRKLHRYQELAQERQGDATAESRFVDDNFASARFSSTLI
jgi:hypothetical protein